MRGILQNFLYLLLTAFAYDPGRTAHSQTVFRNLLSFLYKSPCTDDTVSADMCTVYQGIQDAVNNAKNIVEQKDNSVYKLVDSAGQTRYVGITNNTERRRKEHKNNPNHPERAGYRMDVIATGLTRYEARAVEQTVIAAFTLEKLDNARNEIAKGNLPKFRSEMGAVVEIFQGFNEDEVYNLLTGNW